MIIPDEPGNDPAMKLLRNKEVDALWIYADQAHNYECDENGKKAG